MGPHTVEAIGAESIDTCSCCGRSIFEGEGLLFLGEAVVAKYGYRYSEGHQARFVLGICPLGESGLPVAGLAVARCQSDGESLIYRVLDPIESPWADSEALGKVLSRKEILEDSALPNFFELLDAIAARESRISSRVLAEMANPSVKGTSCGKPQVAPYVER
jgi:hypothetical protein